MKFVEMDPNGSWARSSRFGKGLMVGLVVVALALAGYAYAALFSF